MSTAKKIIRTVIRPFFLVLLLLASAFVFSACNENTAKSNEESNEVANAPRSAITISFIAMDDECTGMQAPITANVGDPFVFPQCTFENQNSNIVFSAWISANHRTEHKPGETAIAIEEETYIAKYVHKPATLTYLPEMDTVSAKCGKVITLPKTAQEKTGYTFSGWTDNTTNIDYAPSATYLVSCDTTFSPLYTPNAVTLNFSANGGSGSVESMQCLYDEVITLPNNGFSKAKYHFAGWFDASTSRTYAPGETYTVRKEDSVTFEAVWEINTSLTLTINETVAYDPLYEIDLNKYLDIAELVRSGYTFYRIVLNVNVSKTNGNCLPGFALYSNQPNVNRNVFQMDKYQVAEFTDDYQIAKEDLPWGHTYYTSPLVSYNGSGRIYLHLLSRAAFLGDVGKNECAMNGSITIEFY